MSNGTFGAKKIGLTLLGGTFGAKNISLTPFNDTFGAKNTGFTLFDGSFGDKNICLTLFDGTFGAKNIGLTLDSVVKISGGGKVRDVYIIIEQIVVVYDQISCMRYFKILTLVAAPKARRKFWERRFWAYLGPSNSAILRFDVLVILPFLEIFDHPHFGLSEDICCCSTCQ